MRPSQVATELRKIAAAIEASKTPDKTKVASAIKGLVKKIANSPILKKEVLPEEDPRWEEWRVTSQTPDGQEHTYKISLEKDGRDADWVRESDGDIDQEEETEIIMSMIEELGHPSTRE